MLTLGRAIFKDATFSVSKWTDTSQVDVQCELGVNHYLPTIKAWEITFSLSIKTGDINLETFISLGCFKRTYDSQDILGQL